MLKSPELPEPYAAYLSSSSGGSREFLDPGPWTSVLPVFGPSLHAQCLLRLSGRRPARRRKREMVPPEKKDGAYMSKRLKNNQAAKMSREKRKMKELLMEGQLLALRHENAHLRDQLLRLRHLSICARKEKPASGRGLCPAYSSVLSKPPLWGEEGGGNPSIPPSFSWAPGFDSLPQSSGLFLGSAAGVERSGGAEAHWQADPSSAPAFLPRPDSFHPSAMFPYQPTTWLVPWLSPLLASPAPQPSLPVCMQGQSLGLGLGGGDLPAPFRSPFNGALMPHFTA